MGQRVYGERMIDKNTRESHHYVLDRALDDMNNGRPGIVIIACADQDEMFLPNKAGKMDVLGTTIVAGTPYTLSQILSYMFKKMEPQTRQNLMNTFYFTPVFYYANSEMLKIFGLSDKELLEMKRKTVNYENGNYDRGDRDEYRSSRKANP